VLDLRSQDVIPEGAARQLLDLLLEVQQMPAETFPYDPSFGEAYNSRERYFVSRLGDTAGWLHAGRPRREATRIALRLLLRRQLVELVGDAARLVDNVADQAARHLDSVMPDQTYLQQAQPSTFGHYILSFAYPTLRDGRRLLEAVDWVNASPGGAGCVNGSRLLADRGLMADLLGFDGIIEHTRDAMWQVDGLIHIMGTTASMLSNQSKLAEDLEIWSSSEFDYVDLDPGFTRASVLMPQKRNPYSLAIVRGAHGILIGRLSGFLAVVKSPSARSDNLIFAYGEVPRSLDMAARVTRLMSGVVRSLQVNTDRMADALQDGFTQATDLAEHIVTRCGIDYRTAYLIVGQTVRVASAAGLRGVDITGEMLDRAAVDLQGRPLGLAGQDLTAVLDPCRIVATRTARGGAAPAAVEAMIASCRATAGQLRAGADQRQASFDRAEEALVDRAGQRQEVPR
ncbi:MAG: argininosuccinate lyase, partial [Actinomycetota bacterium]|nr:argininosuccinate lyase [Actinomycetota bacterium]